MTSPGKDVGFDKELAESLCSLEIPQTIQFSPCGRNVLYATNLTWEHQKGKHPLSTIWLATSGQADSSRQLASGLFEDRYPRWLADGQRVAFISDRGNAGKNSAIWILAVGISDDSEPWPVTPVNSEQRIESFSPSPDGTTLAFASPDELDEETKQANDDDETGPNVWGENWEYAHLRTVDIESRTVTTIFSGNRHVSNVCWSPDGNRLAFQSTQSPDLEEASLTGATISIVNKDGTHPRHICKIYNGGLDDLTWGPDGKIYFVTGAPSHMMSAGRAAYVIDPDSETPQYTRVAGGVNDDAHQLRRCGNRILISLQDRLDTVICALGEDGLESKALYKKSTDIDAWDIFFNSTGSQQTVAAALSDINTPLEVYTIEGDKLIQLSNHGRAFTNMTFGSYTVLNCTSSDGEVELDGIYLTPSSSAQAHTPGSPLPTFVMIHGGPADRNSNRFNAHYYMWAPYILSKGYGVLLPQYRGSRGRGEKFATYSIGGTGVYDYADVIAITDCAISQGYADKNRLLVGGYSQGGFLTYLCSVRNGLHGNDWQFKAAIAGGGICDLDSLSGTSEEGSTFDVELSGGHVAWKLDRENTTNRQGSALWEVAAAMQASKKSGKMVIPPMLILHGESDPICHFSQAVAFRRALQAYGLPYQFVSYPRQEHFFKEQKFWVDMLERIGRWCDDYIGKTDI